MTAETSLRKTANNQLDGCHQSGNFNKVPLLVGNTAEEGKLFSSAFAIDDYTRIRSMNGTFLGTATGLQMQDIIDGTIISPPTAHLRQLQHRHLQQREPRLAAVQHHDGDVLESFELEQQRLLLAGSDLRLQLQGEAASGAAE